MSHSDELQTAIDEIRRLDKALVLARTQIAILIRPPSEVEAENERLRAQYMMRYHEVKALTARLDTDLELDIQRLTQARDSAIGQAKRAARMCVELKRQLELAKSDALIRPSAALGYANYQGGEPCSHKFHGKVCVKCGSRKC